VHLSALLHDVGKIAVPDSILNKPGRLTPEEFEEMKKHPVHGARILANIQSPSIKAVLPGVQYHHEKWDGTGYPEGLTGDAIPVLGRVLGIADFIDALNSARPYRAAVPMDETIGLIRKGNRGRTSDPQIRRPRRPPARGRRSGCHLVMSRRIRDAGSGVRDRNP
jgi:HD-GYP domain-containing protein (c-di-GMP phosphodiesterase class II)